MTDIQGMVAVRYDEDGEVSFHVFGDERVRLFIVDERSPQDRVYEWLPRERPNAFRKMVPEGAEIGSNSDARHAAIAAKVDAFLTGKPHLTSIDGGAA